MENGKGSIYPGVWKKRDEWGAYITIKGEQKYLGISESKSTLQ